MRWIGSIILLMCCWACHSKAQLSSDYVKVKDMNMENKEVAILAGGCFWCVEAPLLLLEGVDTVVSGYIAGHTENPTYAQISTGNTGHAEAVKVTYDTTKIRSEERRVGKEARGGESAEE